RDIHGALLAAEWQSAGRGRRGRVWSAVAGGSLTFSFGWRYEQGAGFMAGLSLAVGVAIVHALEAEGLAGVELKWPNDLIYRHLKVGGILVELNGDALGPSTVVVGVGLNVRLPLSIKRDIAQPVSDLTAVAGRGAATIDRNRLLAPMTLAIDSGNSRMKWGLYGPRGWLGHGVVSNAELATLALRDWQNLPRPSRAVGVNVAGEAARVRVEGQLARWRLPIEWLTATAEAAGVINQYAKPAQLGADRWASLVAARRRAVESDVFPPPCVVINAGTAVTIDALDSDG